MPTTREVIDRLFPAGTVASASGQQSEPNLEPKRNHFPVWPLDAFAAAATLADLSGCYCRSRFTARGSAGYYFGDKLLKQVESIGAKWAGFLEDPDNPSSRRLKLGDDDLAFVQKLWSTLLQGGEIRSSDSAAETWQNAAMTLMLIADCASRGIGFKVKGRPLADLVLQEHALYAQQQDPNLDSRQRKKIERQRSLRHVPLSVCMMVPPDEVCVQPKTRTPQAGCTIRSFSHHLALLPPAGVVQTTWSVALGLEGEDEPAPRPLKLLVVPFPYRIAGSCFRKSGYVFGDEASLKKDPRKRRQRFFALDQKWLSRDDGAKITRELCTFLAELLEVALRETDEVDGLILPELALDFDGAKHVAEFLMKGMRRKTGLELFVSGIVDQRHGIQNSVYGAIFSQSRKAPLWYWTQSKHHRWKLEDGQICRYHLGERLHPKSDWWEEINIEERQCGFWVFRSGCSVVTLVCEDLARIDPVQAVVRSVGPNLVIALLMDGAQKEERWSARYATVLADDPGSAVLTLTSVGLLRRSVMPGEPEPTEIGLWKGGEGKVKVLRLPRDHHALLLTVSIEGETYFTLDGRSDEGNTFELYLSGVHPVKHPRPPEWAR